VSTRPPSATRIAIVGTRHWRPENSYYPQFYSLTLPYLTPYNTIVSGASPGGGVDILARMLAHDLGLELDEYPPLEVDIELGGFAYACYARNSRIVEGSDWMLALPCKHSRGTHDSIRKMRKLGVEPLVLTVDCKR
jgi:hypothetical protein